MKQNLFSIKDTVSGLFCSPFIQTNESVAKRTFDFMLNDQNNDLSKHPQDYQLYRVGFFDDETCVVESNVEFIKAGVKSE